MHDRSSAQLPTTPRCGRRSAVLFAGVLFLSTPMQGALIRACRPTDTPLVCQLQSLLTFLDAAAIFLGLLLIIAVLAAVRAYKRKPKKLTPDEITPDAR